MKLLYLYIIFEYCYTGYGFLLNRVDKLLNNIDWDKQQVSRWLQELLAIYIQHNMDAAVTVFNQDRFDMPYRIRFLEKD